MQIKYICPSWGQEQLTASDLVDKVVHEGYDGIEINFPDASEFVTSFIVKINSTRAAKEKGFIFIAQQVLPPVRETVDAYIERMTKRLTFLATLKPDFINSHTGKDYFSFDDNCRIIEAAMNISQQSGIPILHETHRGRFSFHAAGLLPYLEKFPEMRLVADFSHWCAVSESLLEDQVHILEKIVPHVSHIHARVGYAHGPQVNDPFAPEWEQHVAVFIRWWRMILEQHQKEGKKSVTICPEFGPVPYMPVLPFTRQPVGDQWKINSGIKDLLKKEFNPASF